MKSAFTRIRSILLILLVLSLLLTTVALAGSPGKDFSKSFNYEGATFVSTGLKNDAGTSSGNHATVATQSWVMDNDNATVTYVVRTENGTRATSSCGVSGPYTVNMPYTTSVTNGDIFLHGESNSVGYIAGIWYP